MTVGSHRHRAVNGLVAQTSLDLAGATELEACIHALSRGSLNKYAAVFNEAVVLMRKTLLSSAQQVAHKALACAFPFLTMDSEFESRKAGPDDIACKLCGCKMSVYDLPYRGDEIVPVNYTCSNYACLSHVSTS
jgi:hypothetical protein